MLKPQISSIYLEWCSILEIAAHKTPKQMPTSLKPKGVSTSKQPLRAMPRQLRHAALLCC